MAFQKTKIDNDLGSKVHSHLRSLGLETPTVEDMLRVPPQEKIKQIQNHMTAVMEILGYDLTDDSLEETPKRIAKMWVLETMWGLLPENFPKCTTVENKFGSEMVNVGAVKVVSNCEHHFLPFVGHAHISYIPGKKVLGLSKINRIVEYYSRRAQVQERLTVQILEALKLILETDDVAVVMQAKHLCVSTRGVEDGDSYTTTSALSGAYHENSTCRAEFMGFVNSQPRLTL